MLHVKLRQAAEASLSCIHSICLNQERNMRCKADLPSGVTYCKSQRMHTQKQLVQVDM